MVRPRGRPCRATEEPGRLRWAVHGPGRGPAVHLCVAAGPGERRRPPQVVRGLREWPDWELVEVDGVGFYGS